MFSFKENKEKIGLKLTCYIAFRLKKHNMVFALKDDFWIGYLIHITCFLVEEMLASSLDEWVFQAPLIKTTSIPLNPLIFKTLEKYSINHLFAMWGDKKIENWGWRFFRRKFGKAGKSFIVGAIEVVIDRFNDIKDIKSLRDFVKKNPFYGNSEIMKSISKQELIDSYNTKQNLYEK